MQYVLHWKGLPAAQAHTSQGQQLCITPAGVTCAQPEDTRLQVVSAAAAAAAAAVAVVVVVGVASPQILLRKGGIREPTFTPKAQRFLLFPTAFHSDAQLLKPGVAEQFQQVGCEPKL